MVRPPPALIGVACLVIAGALGTAAIIATGGGAGSDELSAPPASLAATPVTLPPTDDPPPSAPAVASDVGEPPVSAPPVTSPPSQPAAVTTLPTSPLAAMLGERTSALPVPPAVTAPPVRLGIAELGVDVPIRPVGLEADGQLEIPDETEVGWYRLGASPGELGATVLAGHVNWNRVDGPFVRLRDLAPGATVDVTLADGTTRTYQVVERQQYPKTELPAERIWTDQGPETLVLITCGGAFNPDIRRYRDNIVVYAVPIATP